MVITLNGERRNIANGWGDKLLTAGTFCRIFAEWEDPKVKIEDRDYFKLFCILTGTDFKLFNASEHNELAIWNCIRWVIEQPTGYSKTPPKLLKIADKYISIPDKPELLSIGQNIQLRTRIDKMKDLNEGISIATAIFLQPLYDGKPFDINSAMKLKEQIDLMPAYQIWPVGFFLLKNAMTTGSNGSRIWSRIKDSLISMLGKTPLKWLMLKSLPLMRTLIT